MNILDESPSVLMRHFVEEYCVMFKLDTELAYRYIKTQEKFTEMTDDWYIHLSQNDLNKAYSVYDLDYYFTDLWTCFAKYSRGYLRDVRKQIKFDNKETIADLGCGVGLTTAAIKQTFPQSRVIGTNLPNTKQWRFAQQMSLNYGFELRPSLQEKVDVIFASEYFEHIETPLSHLDELIEISKPKCFIIANAFNTRSIGHFETYYHGDMKIDQSQISEYFGDKLRSHGYKKEEMPFFNNKPNVWYLKASNQLFGDYSD
jgi:2-polyprenyl-3-methyl-5-hydroxy-6-metoxy-1,4-benzoquinol methylase